MKVRVFRNLHKSCLSVIACEGEFKGKVIAHVATAYLHQCRMVIHEKSRQRVIKERQKNVHSFVEGDLQCAELINTRYPVLMPPNTTADHPHPIQVRYNPYERGEFYRVSDGTAIWTADCAEVRTDGVWLEPAH